MNVLLLILVILPLIGAAIIAMAPAPAAKKIAVAISLGAALAGVGLAMSFDFKNPAVQLLWPASYAFGVADLGFNFRLGVDSISVWLILLTVLLMPPALLASFDSIKERQKEYYAWMLVLLTAMNGVFVARDLLLFYIFFELTLIPMFFIIGIWGGPERRYAAAKFFLFTFGGSVFTLAAVVYLGVRAQTFDLDTVIAFSQTQMTETERWWILLGLLAGFAVKVPLFPVHTWLPLAHTEAPTAGSVILAGVLLKLGTYGLLRLAVPIGLIGGASGALFPGFLKFLGVLCVIGILYEALVAWVQQDIKKLVAYSSVSHLGFCVLGLVALNDTGMQGSVLYMINHGLSTGAMFLVIGMIYDRFHTRDINELSGLAKRMPKMAFFFVLFVLSSIGLPGTNGFVSEFLTVLGAFTSEHLGIAFGAFAAIGVILGALYMLHMTARVIFGPLKFPGGHSHDHGHETASMDLNGREIGLLIPIAIAVILLGILPRSVLTTIAGPIDRIQASAAPVALTPSTGIPVFDPEAQTRRGEGRGGGSASIANLHPNPDGTLTLTLSRRTGRGDEADNARILRVTMTWSTLIPLIAPELILIAVACALFLMGVSSKPGLRKLSAAMALAALVIVFVMQLMQRADPSAVAGDVMSPIRIGGLAQFIKLLASGVGAMFVLLSWPTNSEGSGNSAIHYGPGATSEFFALLLLSIAGIFLVAGANDLILLFLGIELASIPTYIMVSISRPLPSAQEAGVKYFFLGAMSAAVMLFGFSYLYGTTGVIELNRMGELFVNQPMTRWQLLAAVMVIAGFAFKMAAFPLHFYAGDVYEGAATPVTALLSFVPKTTGFVALIKILFVLSGGTWLVGPEITQLMWVLAVLTMTAGNLLGLMQQNVKRMLAYSSVAHTGYMLVGVTALLDGRAPEALSGVLFYLAAYGLMNVAAFGVLMLLPSRKDRPATSAETIEDLAGTGRQNIALGLAMAVACFSLTGLPLTVGFFGKIYLVRPALNAGDYWLSGLMMVNAAIGAAYYLRVVAVMFLRAEPQEPKANVIGIQRQVPILLAVAISTIGTLLFGTIFPAAQSLRQQATGATSIDGPPRTARLTAEASR